MKSVLWNFSLRTLRSGFMSAIVLCHFSSAIAGDKIGNGGGVWVCQGPQFEVFNVMFMDVFEARREYQLTVPETTSSDLELVQVQKSWIGKLIASGAKINQHIQYVEKNITWIDDVINSIPDAANKISPHPSTCKQGEWKAVQLVNFTDDFRVLVRRDLFQSSFMTNMQRAAVYLHEGIYSYMRTEFGDTNSVRARAVTGFLLADLPDNEKVNRIGKILKEQAPPTLPPPEGQAWICGIKPEQRSALYTVEAATPKLATATVLKDCIAGQDPTHGFPIPGFPVPEGPRPEFPGPTFGPPQNCKESQVLCEQIVSNEKTKKCSITSHFNNKIYVGMGRTGLEAQQSAMKQCMSIEASEMTCYDGSQMTCN